MDTPVNDNGEMGDALEDIVLSWTVSTIQNKQPVKEIPLTFCSTEAYLESYKQLLIEETRTKMLSSLNSITVSQYYRLLNISEEKNSTYFMDIDPSYRHGLGHAASNGDIFLLSTCKPDDFELDKDGVFAMAVDITSHEYFCRSFHVVTKCDVRLMQFNYAIFLCNISCNMRIWRTLQFNMENSILIKKILKPPRAGISYDTCEKCMEQVKSSAFSNSLLINGLDRAQQDIAVLIASKMKCNHSESVEILSGPPRTGKTKIVSVLLEAFKAEANILVCAPTVSSLSPLCSSLAELSRQPQSYNMLPTERVGNIVLLCDKKDEVGITSTQVLSFCIGYRLREIMPCMTWKSRINGLISFLEKGFKEKTRKTEEKFKEMIDKNFALTFLRQELKRRSNILVNLLKTLWIHVPSHVFSEEVEKRMKDLFGSLERLNSLLKDRDVTEEDIRFTFHLMKTKSSRTGLKTSIKNSFSSKYANNATVKRIRTATNECLKDLKYMGRHAALLPFESDIESVRKFLIQETQVILTTPSNSFELHSFERNQADILFVESASQIRECELVIPLSLPSLKHALLIGDSNKVNEKSGFGLSLFQRLSLLDFQNNMLAAQYKTHPIISCLGRVSNAGYVKPNNLCLEFGNYAFINIGASKESVVISSLLSIIVQAWKKHGCNMNLEIGVLGSWTEIDKVGQMQDENGQLNVTVQSIHRIQEEKDFDILIVSSSGFPPDDKIINNALSKARDYFWILGDKEELGKYGGTWEHLIEKVPTTGVLGAKHQPILLASSGHEVNLDILATALGLIVCQPVQIVYEFTWVGRLHNGLPMLPPVRDQRGENHCTLCSSLGIVAFLNKFKCASCCPPSEFLVNLSLRKLLQKYNDLYIGIGEEEGDNGHGVKRLEHVLLIIKTTGANSETDDEVYLISSYDRIYKRKRDEGRTLLLAVQQMREGKIFIGTYRMSLNYIYYKPGDIYEYKRELPILSPLTNQATSHAVMIVGSSDARIETLLKDCHLVMQNSQGTYFGQGGIGRVRGSSIDNLYEVKL